MRPDGGDDELPETARAGREQDHDQLADLGALVRRVVARRLHEPHLIDDVVQETLTRVLAARARVAGDDLAPYAVVTARNLIATAAQRDSRARQKAHLLADVEAAPSADHTLLQDEDARLVNDALSRLTPDERHVLLAHEVRGEPTAALAATRGTTAGAVAAQLSRARAKLRVEYLLAHQAGEPPEERCRVVLRALSLGDRRRQRELGTPDHVLRCDFCGEVAAQLLERWPAANDDEVRIAVHKDADVVTARREGRALAAQAGLHGADLTLVATAISEVTRNIVKFAGRGEVVLSVVKDADRTGVLVVARDVGPGIPDVDVALQDGYSTYNGLGLGLPGCRRLMDEFAIASEVGKGTTVRMTKWV